MVEVRTGFMQDYRRSSKGLHKKLLLPISDRVKADFVQGLFVKWKIY
ncbi:MAG: hypothetical protein ACM65K_26795 [Microcoleus sp.]